MLKKRHQRKILPFCIVLILFLFTTIDAQNILISPDTLYMGQIPATSNAVRQVYITNIDLNDLVISSLTLSNTDGIKILNNPGTKTLKILETLELDIEFSPSTKGDYESQLIITSNAASGQSNLLIYGKGVGQIQPTFERIFGNEEGTGASHVIQTSDGGYFLGGSTTLPDENYSDFYIVKTDYLGEIQWTKTYGNTYSDGISKVFQTNDDGYLVIGTTTRYAIGNIDIDVAKLDSTGNVVWEKTYGGQYDDKPASAVKVSDGYIIVGSTTSSNTSGTDILAIRIDNSGNIIWQKTFGGSSGDNASKIIETQDGNYAIIGSTQSFNAQDFDFYLLKIDGSGNKLWDKLYGGSNGDEGYSIAELQDGSLILCGFAVGFGSGNTGRDMFIIKTDANGNEQWHKAFGGIYQDRATQVVITSDGIVIGGTETLSIQTTTTQENTDIFVIKTDFDGNLLWQSQFGGDQDEGTGEMIINSDGHFIIAGSENSYSKNSNVYFLNINPQGKITRVDDNINQVLPNNFKLLVNYPNPFNGQTQIIYLLPHQSSVELIVYNITGEIAAKFSEGIQSKGQHRIGFNSEGLSSGVYFYRIKTIFGSLTRKMILLK